MKEFKVSVIIPSYNTPNQFLEECISSIFEQTYRNIEVIIVDDGSIKEQADSIDKIVEKKPDDIDVIVFHRENRGASASRNFGLSHANGKYVCFIDADDVLHPDFILYLYKAISETNSDFSSCDFQIVKDYSQIIMNKCNDNYKVWRYGDIWGKTNTGYIWNKMFLKEILSDVRFNEKLSAGSGEDVDFMNKVMEKADQCAVLSEKMYFYRVSGGNVTSNLKGKQYALCRDAFIERLNNKYIKNDSELASKVWCEAGKNEIKYMVCIYEDKEPNWKMMLKREVEEYKKNYVRNTLKCDDKTIIITNKAIYLPFCMFLIFIKALSGAKKYNNNRKKKKWTT